MERDIADKIHTSYPTRGMAEKNYPQDTCKNEDSNLQIIIKYYQQHISFQSELINRLENIGNRLINTSVPELDCPLGVKPIDGRIDELGNLNNSFERNNYRLQEIVNKLTTII